MTRMVTAAALVIGLSLFPPAYVTLSAAGTFHVATTGNDANDCLTPGTACLTIQAAINKAADGDTIRVAAGSYPGAVTVGRRENLTILGTTGAAIVDPGLANGSTVVNVNLSKNILFQDLLFSGNRAGVEAIRIFSSLGITVSRSTIENANYGFFINNNPTVVIADCTVQDSGVGIRVDAGSSVQLHSAPFSPGTSIIQRNITGIAVRSGHFGLLGANIVQENGTGIDGTGGEIRVCCQDGLRKINNNNTGIRLTGVNLDLRGPIEMEGNRTWAIRMFGGFASVSDRVTIRSNGNAGSGAIVVTGGHFQLNGRLADDIDVSNNIGPGVILTDHASAQISNTRITGNSAHGVRVQALSVVRLFNTAVLRDNAGFDLSCTPNSFGRGDRSGVKKMFCPGFDQSPDPGVDQDR